MNVAGRIKGLRTMSSREFNQHASRAKAAADAGPLVITDRGRPAYVLMRVENYAADPGSPGQSALDAIADTRPEADFRFDFPRAVGLARDFSFDEES